MRYFKTTLALIFCTNASITIFFACQLHWRASFTITYPCVFFSNNDVCITYCNVDTRRHWVFYLEVLVDMVDFGANLTMVYLSRVAVNVLTFPLSVSPTSSNPYIVVVYGMPSVNKSWFLLNHICTLPPYFYRRFGHGFARVIENVEQKQRGCV